MRVALVVALALVACTAPAAASPTPVPPGSARPSPTELPRSGAGTLSKLADGTLVVSIPDCQTAHVGTAISGCELLQAAVDRGVFVAVLRWSDGYLEARTIDLTTGEMRSLVPKEDRGLQIEDVRDDIVIMREYDDQGAGSIHVRLLRISWRDASNVTTLDEIDLAGVGGGDTWNPWPYARTNGRDVVWLHAGGLLAPHAVVLAGANGQKRTIYQNSRALWFDIDEAGRVAIAAEKETTQELVVYENGATRQRGTRDGAAEGYPMSFGDVIGWTRGIGMVRLITEVELVPLAAGPSKAAPIPSGCVISGRSLRDIVTVCTSGVRLVDATTGASRDGPNSRVVQTWRRGLLWRTAGDLAANPQVWRIALLG